MHLQSIGEPCRNYPSVSCKSPDTTFSKNYVNREADFIYTPLGRSKNLRLREELFILNYIAKLGSSPTQKTIKDEANIPGFGPRWNDVCVPNVIPVKEAEKKNKKHGEVAAGAPFFWEGRVGGLFAAPPPKWSTSHTVYNTNKVHQITYYPQ